MVSERILIADPDSKIISLVRLAFSGAGYGVMAAVRGEQAVVMTAKEQPALVILDVVLTGELDGYETLRRIREFSDVPVIVLSPSGEPEDSLRAFHLGADDYVTRPFDPKVLLARAQAILKRCRGRVNAPAEIVCDDLVIDLAAHRVTRGGSEIVLTDTEYNLLLELARHRDRVCLHDELLDAVWGKEYHGEVGYLRSYVHILRRKLEHDPSQPRMIVSRPGIGYMLITAQNNGSGE